MTVIELRKVLENFGAQRPLVILGDYLCVQLEDNEYANIYIDPTSPSAKEVSLPMAKGKGKMPMKKGGKKGC